MATMNNDVHFSCPSYMRISFSNEGFFVEAFLPIAKDMYEMMRDDADNPDGILRGYYKSQNVRVCMSPRSTYLVWCQSYRYDMTTPEKVKQKVINAFYPTMRMYYKQMQIQRLSKEIANIQKNIIW